MDAGSIHGSNIGFLKRVAWPGSEPLPGEPGPTRAVLARTFLYLYGAGGFLAAGTLLLPAHPRAPLGIAGPAVAALGVAVVMLLVFDRVPLLVFRLLPTFGTVLVTIVVLSGSNTSILPYAAFYSWVVLSSFYLFEARWAWLNTALVGAAFGLALSLRPERPERLLAWVMVMGSLSVGGALIGLLRARLERLVGQTQAALENAVRSERALADAQRIARVGSWEMDPESLEFSGSPAFFRILGIAESAISLDAVLTALGPDRDVIVGAARTAFKERGSFDAVHQVLLPGGKRRFLHTRGRATGEKLMGTTQDVTERTEQEQRLHSTLRQLRATTDIAMALAREPEASELLELVSVRARALLSARGVLVLLAEHGCWRIAATTGTVPPLPADISTPAAGDELVTGGVRRLRRDDVDPLSQSLCAHDAHVLVAPLTYRDEFHGLLVAIGAAGDDGFSHVDEEMMQALASAAATAVAGAKTVQRSVLHRSIQASERERGRFARELHDQTLQGLAGLQMRLETALRESPDTLAPAVAAALLQIGGEVEELRRIIADLRPAVLDDFGLTAALDGLVEDIAAKHAIEVQAEIDLADDARFEPELEQSIYRIVQEALANVCKHADATRVVVTVKTDGERLTARVADNGTGFEPEARRDGFGLVGMAERVKLLHGSLEVESRDSGTVVQADFPLEPAAREHLAV